MLDFILKPITVSITAIGLFVGGLFGMIPDSKLAELQQELADYKQQLEELQSSQTLGAYYSVGGKQYTVFGSGITSSATTLILTSFTMPINDQEFVMEDFGEYGYGVIEPNNSSNVEFISFTGITQDSSTAKATLTGVSRGLSFTFPYAASTTLAKSHSGGSRFIISNPPAHYGEFTAKRNNETIWGDWTYSATNTPQYNNNPTFTSGSKEFASVKFAEDQANQGAATISTTTPGIGLIATSDILINFTTTTGYASSTPWLLRAFDAATSTDKRGATTTIMMTDTDGKLSQSFIDFTEPWKFTASTTMSATTTIGDASSDYFRVNASTTFYASTTFASLNNGTSTFDNGVLFNSTSTRFARFPTIQATPTDQYHLATKSYVDVGDSKHISTWLLVANGTATWADVDLTTSTSASAKIAEMVMYIAGNQIGGVRPNGSADNRYFTATQFLTFITELDSDQILEYYSQHAGGYLYLIGYWE